MGGERKNIAVIGCGYWGKNLIRNFWELEALTSLYDIDEKRLKEMRNLYPQVKILDRLSDLYQDPLIDGVVVATPAESHYRVVKDALRREGCLC